MLLTTYKNENGDIDKVVLVSEGPEDSQALLDCYDHFKPKSSDSLLYSAGFVGEGQDPNLIDGDAERAKLEAISAEYKQPVITPVGDKFQLSRDGVVIGVFDTYEDAEKAGV